MAGSLKFGNRWSNAFNIPDTGLTSCSPLGKFPRDYAQIIPMETACPVQWARISLFVLLIYLY